MKRRIAVLLAVGMLSWPDLHAQQQTAKTTFKVSTRVQAVCEIISSDLDLGTSTARSAGRLLGTAHLQATCTPNTTYNVGLSTRTSSWPDTVTGRGTGRTQDHTVFGAVPATEVVSGEERNDPVTVRIYY